MARADLARLVRSLIRETNDQVVTLEMRGGEGSEVPGYDGIVEATKATPFVPEGRSVWELGTGEEPTDKASADYRTRTADPLKENQAETTFVFVTPRRWPEKNDWIARRKEKSPWKAIKVLDVDDIETALDQASGTHHIFSDLLGKGAFGVQGLEEWWRKFASVSNPRLTEPMALAGREDEATALLSLLAQDIGRTTISAASTDDVLAFVAASIASADVDTKLDLFSRCLIVHEAHALRVLDRTAKLLILLPYDEALQHEGELIQNHHVVLLALRDMPTNIKVSDINQERFAQLLQDAGVMPERARNLAQAASRSLVAFQRQASAAGAVLRPSWTDWMKSSTLRRAWLAGGWIEIRSGDADVMGVLLGQTLDSAGTELREASAGGDPILVVVASVWAVASPEATWDYLHPHLTHADLSALERSVQDVLGAIDPKLELPMDKRWQAAVYGKSRIHSENLRKGLATTLALLGGLGESVQLGHGLTVRAWAEATVRQLLERANEDSTGQLWTSLSDVLELLAEAAPAQFLRAVHKGTEGANPVLAKLFTDQDASFTTSSGHPGLLWALEGLAWAPEFFALTLEGLARLVELDPGGRLSNRPSASYVSVLRPAFPQTSATPEARLAVLDSLRERHPEKAWRILLSLLPGWLGGGTYNHAPRFRKWKSDLGRVSPQEYWQMIDGVIEDLFAMLDESPDRWPELIERIPDLPGPKRDEVYERLNKLGDYGDA